MASNYGSGKVGRVEDKMFVCIDAAASSTIEQFGGRTISGSISASNYTPSSAGKTAKAFVLANGGSEYGSFTGSRDWNWRGDYSYEFIACKETSANRQYVFSQLQTNSPWNGICHPLMSHDGDGNLQEWGGNYVSHTGAFGFWDTGISLDNNKWYYCAGTWSGNSRKAYVRTVGDSSFTTATTTSHGAMTGSEAVNPFVIGGNASGLSTSHMFDGAIAMIRMYKTQLTDDEVEQNFNAQRDRYGL